MGILFAAVAVIPLLTMMGVLPQARPTPDPAPSWIGWLIGLVFGCGGIVLIMRGFVGGPSDSGELPTGAPRALRWLNELLSMIIVCGLAAMLTWVAFGPGPRHFIVSGAVSGVGVATRTSGAGDILGRIFFGLGSVMAWFMAAYMAYIWFRRR